MTDREITERVLAGQSECFDLLVRKYANAVFSVAYQKVRDMYLAQDIAQEVFLKAYLNLARARTENIGNWLYSITLGTSIDELRRRKEPSVLDLPDQHWSDQPEEVALREEFRSDVWKALDSLSETVRLSTVLFHIGGYSMKEIAQFLDVSEEAVESRLRRARSKLRKEMIHMVGEEAQKGQMGEEFEAKVKELIQEYQRQYSQGEVVQALQTMREAVRLRPDDPGLRQRLATVLWNLGAATQNQQLLDEAEAVLSGLEQSHWKTRLGLAMTYLGMQQFDRSMAILRDLQKDGVPESANLLATALFIKGENLELVSLTRDAAYRNLSGLLLSLNFLTEGLRRLKDPAAVDYNQIALALLSRLDSDAGLAQPVCWACLLRAEIEFESDPEKGLAWVDKAIDLARRAVDQPHSRLFPSPEGQPRPQGHVGGPMQMLLQSIRARQEVSPEMASHEGVQERVRALEAEISRT